MNARFKSRKFVVTVIQTFLMIIIPMIYKAMEIDTTVTMTVLISIAAAGSFYTGFNVLSKKLGLSDDV